MLEFTVMTPWEYREKEEGTDSRFYFSYSDSLGSTNKEVFNKIFMRDLDDWEEKGVDNLVPELLSEPVYAEYIGLFHGDEVDGSPLRICPDGYTLQCDSYRCIANSVYSDILEGLVILAQEKYSYRIVVAGMNELAVRFLANRDETYRVVISAFSDFPSTLALSFGDLSQRITVNGKPLSLKNAREIESQYDELDDDILRKMVNVGRLNTNHKLIFDVSKRLTHAELSDIDGSWKKREFSVYVHDSIFQRDYYPIRYPYIYALEDIEGGAVGSPCNIGFDNLAQMTEQIYKESLSRASDRIGYAIWFGSNYYLPHSFQCDLFKNVMLYVFVDKGKKHLHIYDGQSPLGRERYIELIRKSDIEDV